MYLEAAIAAGEPPEDPLILFSVLFGFWVANLVAFDGDLVRELAGEFMERAERQGVTAPLMIAHASWVFPYCTRGT